MTWPSWGWRVIAAGIGMLAILRYGCDMKQAGKLADQIKAKDSTITARDQTIAILEQRKTRVDTVKAKAKIRWLTTKTAYDSARKVEPSTPFTVLADSAVYTCALVLQSCERQVAIRDSLLGEQRAQIGNLRERVKLEAQKHPDHFLGFIPKPPKWLAATLGCALGSYLDQHDRLRGCGLGGAASTVIVPTN